MSVVQTQKSLALLIVFISLLIQLGFAFGLFGPAWLSPVLSLPALASIAFLWRRAERQNQQSQAFNRLVI